MGARLSRDRAASWLRWPSRSMRWRPFTSVRRTLLKSKIHRATITEARLDYMGSLGIDQRLMKLVGIVPNEMVHVVNVNNGERLATYAIPASPGESILNGAAARKGRPGELPILMTFAQPEHAQPRNH